MCGAYRQILRYLNILPHTCAIFIKKKTLGSRISNMIFRVSWHIPVCPPIQLVPKFRTICWRSVSGSSGRHFWKQRRTSHWQLVECNKQTKVRSPMWFCFYIVLFYLTFNDWITFSYVSLLHHGLYMMCHDPTTSNMNIDYWWLKYW